MSTPIMVGLSARINSKLFFGRLRDQLEGLSRMEVSIFPDKLLIRAMAPFACGTDIRLRGGYPENEDSSH